MHLNVKALENNEWIYVFVHGSASYPEMACSCTDYDNELEVREHGCCEYVPRTCVCASMMTRVLRSKVFRHCLLPCYRYRTPYYAVHLPVRPPAMLAAVVPADALLARWL